MRRVERSVDGAEGVPVHQAALTVAVVGLLAGCGSPAPDAVAPEDGVDERVEDGRDHGGDPAAPLVTTDGGAIRVHDERGRLAEELFGQRLDGDIAGLQIAPATTADEPPALAYAVEGGDGPAVLISREQDKGAPSLFGDEEAAICQDGTPMQQTSGPAWSPDGDAVAVAGLCPTDGSVPELRLIVEGVDYGGAADHEELGNTSWTSTEQRTFELDSGDDHADVDVDLVRWQADDEAEQLVFVVRQREASAAAQLGIQGRDDDLLMEEGPLEAIGPPAATSEGTGGGDPRQVVAVDTAGHGHAVERDALVLTAVAPADVDGMHDLRLHDPGPEPHDLEPDDHEALPLPDELIETAGSPEEMFDHWLAGGTDLVVVGDGQDRAWVVDRDTHDVAELEGNVSHATVRD